MKILHNILKGVSLTGALFVFQACYGMPEPPLYGERGLASMSFTVISHSDGTPLEGIKVKGDAYDKNPEQVLGVTDAKGQCKVSIPYYRNVEGPFLRFEGEEGQYMVKDTTLADLRERDIVIKMFPIQ